MSDNEFHDSTDCSRATGEPDTINPSVLGTPDILATLRARAMHGRLRTKVLMEEMTRDGFHGSADYYRGCSATFDLMSQWLDELSEANQQHSTRHDVE